MVTLIRDLITRLLQKEVIMRIKRDGSTLSIIQKGRGRNAMRTMFYDNVVFSSINLSTIYTHSYWDYFLPLPSIFSKANILILGLGGGTIPYQMNTLYKNNLSIDVVEIDSDIITLSKIFLGKEVDADIINEDALSYIKNSKKKYNIIIMDLYIANRIPSEFTSSNFLKRCKFHLENKGIFALNFAFSGENSSHYHTLRSNLNKVFRSLYTISPLSLHGNVILVSLKNIRTDSLSRSIKQNFPLNKENLFLINAYNETFNHL